jgi:hypothetical protein
VSSRFSDETAEEFQHTGTEARAANLVRTAIRALQLQAPGRNQWNLFRRHYEPIRNTEHNDDGIFADPGQARDQLYARTNQGSSSLVVRRQRRPDDERIKVWYGKTGSGDRLMRNPDEPREGNDIVGPEMGAAGVVNTIPVGVIQGVCDYADEQKNKEWQPFAAAMAAAYAMALLYQIEGSAITRGERSSQSIFNIFKR